MKYCKNTIKMTSFFFLISFKLFSQDSLLVELEIIQKDSSFIVPDTYIFIDRSGCFLSSKSMERILILSEEKNASHFDRINIKFPISNTSVSFLVYRMTSSYMPSASRILVLPVWVYTESELQELVEKTHIELSLRGALIFWFSVWMNCK